MGSIEMSVCGVKLGVVWLVGMCVTCCMAKGVEGGGEGWEVGSVVANGWGVAGGGVCSAGWSSPSMMSMVWDVGEEKMKGLACWLSRGEDV